MDKNFYFVNGKAASNLQSFTSVVKSLNSTEFSHHVNSERNDFASWVEACLNNKDLASKLKSANTKAKTVSLLEDTLHGKVEAKKESVVKKSVSPKTVAKKSSSSNNLKSKKVVEKKQEKETSVPVKEESDYVPSRHSYSSNKVHYISTEAPHTFILKEFLFGALFGLLLGLILMAMLVRAGVYF